MLTVCSGGTYQPLSGKSGCICTFRVHTTMHARMQCDPDPHIPSAPPAHPRSLFFPSACGANTYSLDGASSCSSCLAGSASTSGSSACTCNAGYFSANGLSTSQPCTSTILSWSNLKIMQPTLTCLQPIAFASVRVRSRPLASVSLPDEHLQQQPRQHHVHCVPGRLLHPDHRQHPVERMRSYVFSSMGAHGVRASALTR